MKSDVLKLALVRWEVGIAVCIEFDALAVLSEKFAHAFGILCSVYRSTKITHGVEFILSARAPRGPGDFLELLPFGLRHCDDSIGY